MKNFSLSGPITLLFPYFVSVISFGLSPTTFYNLVLDYLRRAVISSISP
jgi:hypothetical protein